MKRLNGSFHHKHYVVKEYKPPDACETVATPATYCTTLGSMSKNWKSLKSTFKVVSYLSIHDKILLSHRAQ